MKQDQVAYYSRNEKSDAIVKNWFGLLDANWIYDEVTAEVVVGARKGVNVAELQFCDKLGTQFELIRYISGPNWLEHIPFSSRPSIAHIGYHLEDGEDWPPMIGCTCVQQATTIKHTAPHIGNKRYQYRIFEMSSGHYVKFIKRVTA